MASPRSFSQRLTSLSISSLLLTSSTLAQRATPQQPIGLGFSQRTYGPDGPWNAVTVGVGSPVDLYPGVCGYTIVVDNAAASANSRVGGTFNPQRDAVNNGPSNLLQTEGSGWSLNGSFYSNNMTLGNNVNPASGITLFSGNAVARNSDRQLPIGFLDVGFPSSNFSVDGCSRSAGLNCSTTTSPPTYYQRNNMISSSSFGMTLGSAALGIPGSFHYGGYDLSRIVGPVGVMPLAPAPPSLTTTNNGAPQTIWHDFFQTQLLQVGVRTVVGGSPLATTNTQGVLPNNNGSLRVQFDPSSPYLYLPRNICDRLAQPLPVTFNSSLNLYLWNTSDPQYTQIIQSPTVMSLTLATQNTDPVVINVPFSLLNLTLVPPLVAQPTQYFPCQPTNATISVLGRAILQATYLGANWKPDSPDGVFFFGQAPGPGMQAARPVGIAAPDSSFPASGQAFADSWNGHWTPVNAGSGGLSTGAAAGIGVGVAIGVIGIAAALGAWWFLRRRRQRDAAAAAAAAKAQDDVHAMHAGGGVSPDAASPHPPPAYKHSPGGAPAELSNAEVAEIGAGPERFEADGTAKPGVVAGKTAPVEAGDGRPRVFAELE